MGELVLTDIDVPIATCTLNRGDSHNSLIPELLDELLLSLETIKAEAGVRAVILQANGRSFSTGGDLRGFASHLRNIEDYASELVGKLNEVILTMRRLPVPVIAAVHGLVTGGSLGLLLGADLVLIAPQTQIIPYYSVVGFSPDGGWTACLPDIIGRQRTEEILLLNKPITAQQAVEWGLANMIVQPEDIRDRAKAVALNIANNNEGSTVYMKKLLWDFDAGLQHRLEEERSRFVERISKPETQQSMLKFLQAM